MRIESTCSMVATLLVALWASELRGSDRPFEFFQEHCLDCHSGDAPEGDVNLETPPLDWARSETGRFWEKIIDVIGDRRMPPADSDQPGDVHRQEAVESLHKLLQEHVRPGGTVLRRLNRAEYENTIRDVLKIPYSIPPSFPADAESHGFENVAEGLILSPPLMEQYFLAATEIADLVIPPAQESVAINPDTVVLDPDDFSVNFEGSKVRHVEDEKVLRLVTKNEVLVRSSTWPTRFEARHSGAYSLTITAGAFKPKTEGSLKVRLLAFKSSGAVFTSTKTLRLLAELEIDPSKGTSTQNVSVELEKGETVAFYWANAPFGWDRDGKTEAARQLRERLKAPAMYAAWMKMGFDRGRTPTAGWNQMKELIKSGTLDQSDPQLEELPERFTATSQNQLMWMFEVMHHETGPALDIHSVTVTGPTRLIEDKQAREQRRRTEAFMGNRDGRNDREYATAILNPVLDRLFRRPATSDQTKKYVDVALSHHAAGYRFEDGIHLALRAALCSPTFLYRGSRPGRLDDYDLASRLSYFLWRSPPDAVLMRMAAKGQLSDSDLLAAQTRRLLGDQRAIRFLRDFTDQWLDLKQLPEIMPDPRLLKFTDKDLRAITDETQMFVEEIFRKNYPIDAFIEPGFTYVNSRNARLYEIDGIKGDSMRRVSIEKEGRFGGVLGQAAVMMATANGVDTQPVLRGVWLLENIFGEPPPSPPSSVPAIEPDTSGATSIRELLSRHQADPSCAKCHRRIDPLGFALENFDPVGRWRSHYPVYGKRDDGTLITRNGQQIDAAGVLPDGTTIRDVTDLKRYLVEHIDQFSACLAEKLLVYGTGRPLNYADRQVVDRVVVDVQKQGNGFRDLIIAVVLSETFRTK